MKIYIRCDMEGVSGLFTREHAWFWEDGVRESVHLEGRRLYTEDINSAAAAALEAGADAVTIYEAHHGGGNLLWDRAITDPRITYDAPKARMIIPRLDETFDGLILLGHHAKAGAENAFLPHTWSGDWADFQINGVSVGEVGLEACCAGHWNVPLIMAQGDAACCAEVQSQFPGVVTAEVKRAIDFDQCTGPPLAVARRLTAEKVAEALAKARPRVLNPFRTHCPMTVRITMTSVEAADSATGRPNVRRVDELTVEGSADRQSDVLAWTVG